MNLLIIIFLLIYLMTIIYHQVKRLPKNISYESDWISADNIEFLYDLTYQQNNKQIKEHNIFNTIYKEIEKAEKFIIIDFFLYNDLYPINRYYEELANKMTETLIKKKENNPNIDIYVLVDDINGYYGSFMPIQLKRLSENGVFTGVVKLNKLRDSNYLYSGLWRILIGWKKIRYGGKFRNIFTKEKPNINLLAILNSLNFKANHRKVVLTEKSGIVTSANPHDPSADNSNIGFKIEGKALKELFESEIPVFKLANVELPIYSFESIEKEQYSIKIVTEKRIKGEILRNIKKLGIGDKLLVAQFYLSDRIIINQLIKASNRGAEIDLILDPTKDAFGLEKKGIPNRPVAWEIKKRAKDINLRWYATNGEQFHTKVLYFKFNHNNIIIGGSANLTRRNLNNYNLETDMCIKTYKNSNLDEELERYFYRLINNDNGNFTLDYEMYIEKTIVFKYFLYRFQEWTGMCTY